MGRLLPALAALYALGIVAADRGAVPARAWLWLALHALALGLAFPRLRAACALAAAFAAGGHALGVRLEDAAEVRLHEPLEAVVEGRLERRHDGPAGPRLELRELAAIDPPGSALPRGAVVFADGASELAETSVGSRLRIALRLAPPRPVRNPGARDTAHALARRALAAVATPVHPALHAVLQEPRRKLLDPIHEFRARGIRRLGAEGRGGRLLAALGLGHAAGVDATSRVALAQLGLSHLVAVSGLHLALVAAPLYASAAVAARRSTRWAARSDTRRPALVLAVTGAALYALLTGFAAPVRRALVFLTLLVLSHWTRRPARPAHVLGAAALLVSAHDPATLFDPGFELSFVAAAALLWSAPPPTAARGGARAAVMAVLRGSASASAASAALVAHHFGVVAPLGWLANALAVPLTALLLLPLALGSSLLAAAAPDAEGPVAVALRAASELAGRLLAGCVALADVVPAWGILAPGALGMATSCGLALVTVRARRTPARLALAVCAAAAPALGRPPPVAPAVPRVVFLDVGQGDAALVQGRRGAVLVDAGRLVRDASGASRFDAGERIVRPALGALGVRRLDLVVVSHADLDHRGGVVAVLRALPVTRLWLPPGGREEPAFAVLRDVAHAEGVALSERAAGEAPLRIGDLRVEALWPPRLARGLARNDASLVVRIEVAGRSVLFAGDLEQPGEERLLRSHALGLRSNVLKLGHHGSRSSSSAAFLDAVGPDLAVVSAPRHGRFGMPHPEVRARLADARVPWRWTGRDGALLVGLGPTLSVRAFAADAPDARAALRAPARGATLGARRAR